MAEMAAVPAIQMREEKPGHHSLLRRKMVKHRRYRAGIFCWKETRPLLPTKSRGCQASCEHVCYAMPATHIARGNTRSETELASTEHQKPLGH
eukprot:1034584-Rhodomonas_salina.1